MAKRVVSSSFFAVPPVSSMIDCSDSISSSFPVMCMGTMKYFESQQDNCIIGTVKSDLDLLIILLM